MDNKQRINEVKHWGGVEGWGEKAYNCNWITIKIKKTKNKNIIIIFKWKNYIVIKLNDLQG